MTDKLDARIAARVTGWRGATARPAMAALVLAAMICGTQAQPLPADPSMPVRQPAPETAASDSPESAQGKVELAALPADPSQPVPQPPLETGANDRTESTTDNVKLAALPAPRAEMPSCVPKALVATIRKIEQDFGPVVVISTYRKGAVVAGTGRPSRHADCRAVDFRPAKGSYQQVATWLKANHGGGVGTYSGHHNHIHIDNGGRYRWHN